MMCLIVPSIGLEFGVSLLADRLVTSVPGVRLQVADSPIAAMMWDLSAVAFREVTAEHPKDHSRTGTDNHEQNPGCNSSCEVRKEEDNNSRVHQNRQHCSR